MTNVASPSTPNLGILEFTTSPRQGLVVGKLDRFASLAKGGVMVGDELLAFDGTPLSELDTPEKVIAFATAIGVGNAMTVRLARGGAEQELTIKLLAKKSFSLSLDEVDPTLERKIAPAALSL